MDTRLQPFIDKIKIIAKDECTKWDMKRWHYIIKIGDEVFNYYGSNKEFIDEDRCKECGRNIVGSFDNRYSRMMNKVHGKEVSEEKYNAYVIQEGAKRLKLKIPTDDEIKTNALYCLIMDYSYGDYDLADFLEEMGYDDDKKIIEGIKIHKEIGINKQRMDNVFTRDEIELLTNLYSDF